MKVLPIALAAFAIYVASQTCNDTARWNFRPKMYPYGQVRYCFVNFTNETEKTTILTAMSWITNAVPCITFIPHTMCSNNKVVKGVLNIIYQNTTACESSVGYPGLFSEGRINMGTLCHGHVGRSCHELCHSLGRGHTHNNFKRDNYITITWDCIKPDVKPGFCPMYDGTEWPAGHVCEFDFGSIMLNAPKGGAVNGSCTVLRPLNSTNIISGQRTGLSKCDADHLKKMYNCEDPTTTSTTTTTSSTTTTTTATP